MITQAKRLRREIAAEQEALGDNLHELETRVRAAADWRVQVERRPLVMVGVAFGGGILLSALAGPRSRGRRRTGAPPVADAPVREPREPSVGHETWRRFKGALFASLAVEAAEMLSEVLPGFREEYRS